jgi:hypothetical protein
MPAIVRYRYHALKPCTSLFLLLVGDPISVGQKYLPRPGGPKHSYLGAFNTISARDNVGGEPTARGGARINASRARYLS